jgi:hypothetical protein
MGKNELIPNVCPYLITPNCRGFVDRQAFKHYPYHCALDCELCMHQKKGDYINCQSFSKEYWKERERNG